MNSSVSQKKQGATAQTKNAGQSTSMAKQKVETKSPPTFSFSGLSIQTKLSIGQPNDKYEREADSMADRIMRMPQKTPNVQRKCAACEEEEKVRTKPLMLKAADSAPRPTAALSSQLNSSKGSGRPLPNSTNQFMSNAFGADFSSVRIHTGSKATAMNQGLNARAFTHGADIYFNRGQYRPGTAEGKRLLGHELTHVVQQKGGADIINRACLPAASCPTVGGVISVPGSASTFGTSQAAIEAPARARRKRMTCARATSTTHFGHARQLEIILSAADPALLGRVHGIFIDADISPGTGALVTNCASWEARTLPAGCHPASTAGATKPCIFVPAALNQEAFRFNTTTSPTIGGRSREDWHISTTQTLIHEAQHVTFGDAIVGRPAPAGTAACPRNSVFAEITEINAILSEFPVVFRAVPVTPGPARTHALGRLNNWFNHSITNPHESLSGTLKAMRCTCDCPEVNAHIQDVFNFVTSTWSVAEKNAFNTELRRPVWNVPSIDLRWPL